MLKGTWGIGYTHSLLVGLNTGIATMEISVKEITNLKKKSTL